MDNECYLGSNTYGLNLIALIYHISSAQLQFKCKAHFRQRLRVFLCTKSSKGPAMPDASGAGVSSIMQLEGFPIWEDILMPTEEGRRGHSHLQPLPFLGLGPRGRLFGGCVITIYNPNTIWTSL